LDFNEDPEVAGLRELREECGLQGEVVRLLAVAGKPDRDPRGHYVTILYQVSVADTTTLKAGDDAAEARFYPLSELLERPEAFAFDHYSLLRANISP
jgi:8-oxo-dGTP diphosphatase